METLTAVLDCTGGPGGGHFAMDLHGDASYATSTTASEDVDAPSHAKTQQEVMVFYEVRASRPVVALEMRWLPPEQACSGLDCTPRYSKVATSVAFFSQPRRSLPGCRLIAA